MVSENIKYIMTNLFSHLDIDEGDKFLVNRTRKFNFLVRQQEKNPTPERAIAIAKLNLIINPPIKKKKKVNNENYMSEDDILDKAFKENREHWFKENERIKKEKISEELKKKKEREEKIAREKQEKQRKEEEEEKKVKEKTERIKKIMKLPNDIREFISRPPDKKVYKKLALKHHPDKGGNIEHFKIINNYMNK